MITFSSNSGISTDKSSSRSNDSSCNSSSDMISYYHSRVIKMFNITIENLCEYEITTLF